MRRSSTPLVCALLALSASTAAAQSLAQRVERAPADRDVTFEFPARPDVCGYGDAVVRFHDDSRRGYSVMYHRGDWRDISGLDRAELARRCEYGPVRVLLERDGRAIGGIRVRVGGVAPASAQALGAVTTAEASEYLVAVARSARKGVANDALSALLIADGEYWPPLLRLAQDRSVARETRKTAIFWLGQAAGEKATAGLKGILGDDSEELDVRRQAVFALSQQRNEAAVTTLIDVAQTSREPEIRKHALFWLGQRDDDPRVIALFEKILLGKN